MSYSAEDHVRLRRVSSIAVSPDGSWLAACVERLDREGAKYVSDIWKLQTDGSAPVPLTRGQCRDTAPCFRHDGALGFLSNRQPNEIEADEEAEKRMQVWVLPAGGGEPEQLTDEPLGAEAFRFARAADRLLLLAPVISGLDHEKQRETASERDKNGPSARRFTRQPVRHWDHWLHEDASRGRTHLIAYSGDGRNRVDLTPEITRELEIEPELDVTSDGRRAALTYATPGKDRELDTSILLIDIEAGTRTLLGGGTNVNNEQPKFSPDGQTLAVVRSARSSERAVRPLLHVIELAGGGERMLAEAWDRWPHLHGWSPDGSALIVTADEDGDTPVFSVQAASGEVSRLTTTSAGGAHSGIDTFPDGRIAGIRSTLLEPPECFVIDPVPGAQPRPLARISDMQAAGWAEVERGRATSSDGTAVQFFVVKPKDAGGPLPMLLWIHGGPIGMSSDSWHWRWNPLLAVARGYGVVLPNPRGSTGFGQAFIQGIWGNVWGEQCYRDLMVVADAVAARPDADPARLMAMGGSFGGYMTNWIGTQTDRFRCLITHASIFAMAQFTGTTDHPAWWYLEMGGEDPYQDPVRFNRYAPAAHVKNWTTPTLILHGEQDYRCPIGEGLNLFEALQYHGVESELVIFPDENHWILKPRNIVAWYTAVLDFLARHMPA